MKFLTRSNYEPYQHRLEQVIVDNPICLLVLAMAGGKTVCALSAAGRLIDDFQIMRVLVVAPVRVARDSWPDEFKKWEHLKKFSFRVCVGEMKPKDRLEALHSGAEFIITNRENLKWVYENIPDKDYFQMLIYDESSRLKSGRARTPRKKCPNTGKVISGGNTTEFGYICRLRSNMSRVLAMTGTPTPNGLQDLWGQIYLLDSGKRLGRSLHAFRTRWFYRGSNGFTYHIKPRAEEEILSAVSDIMFGLSPEEKMNNPPSRVVDIPVRIPDKHMKEYRKLARHGVSELYDVDSLNKAVLTGKLAQYANGCMYRKTEDDKREVVVIHDEKLKALDELLEELKDKNVIIAYNFDFDLEAIRKRYKGVVVADEDPDYYSKWNAGKIKILLAHPASIGHGLNLQFGGHIAIWFGLTWSLELYQQFNTRLPRKGQKEDYVTIYRLITKETIEDKISNVLEEKGMTQDRVIEIIRMEIDNF
jgi:SNF2 family DNA or RNA helicase